MICIYGLVDPRKGTVQYIGQTTIGAKNRLKQHVSSGGKRIRRKVCRWITVLSKNGLVPTIEILEAVDDVKLLNDAERFWIANFRSCGAILLNMTDGGEGAANLDDEARKRKGAKIRALKLISHHLRGKKHRPETIAKMKAAHVGKKWTAEQIEKRTAWKRKVFTCLNTGERFSCIREAVVRFETSPGNIRHVLKGRRRAIKGWRFEYCL